MPVPGSPLPLFSVPLRAVDGQVSAAPVAVSVRTSWPDFIDTGPPGRTVQVAAARTVVTPRVAASTAAGTANRLRAYRFLTCSVLRGLAPSLIQGMLISFVPGARAGQGAQADKQRGAPGPGARGWRQVAAWCCGRR